MTEKTYACEKVSVLDFLFPNHSCLICRTEINISNNHLLCNACISKLPVAEKTCEKCGQCIGEHATVCDRCKKAEWFFDKAASAFVYEGEVVKLVLRLKNNAEGDVAKAVVRFMAKAVAEKEMDADIIIPVPLSPKRKKARGYNQSELLAKEISLLLGKEVNNKVVVRVKQTEKQKAMTAKQREENLKNAFCVVDKKAVRNKKILLIDDVLTTGATTNELASVLKKAGSGKVYVITIANTQLKPLR